MAGPFSSRPEDLDRLRSHHSEWQSSRATVCQCYFGHDSVHTPDRQARSDVAPGVDSRWRACPFSLGGTADNSRMRFETREGAECNTRAVREESSSSRV